MASPHFGSPVFAAAGGIPKSMVKGFWASGRLLPYTTQKWIKSLSKGNQEWSSASKIIVLVVLTECGLHMQIYQKHQVQSLLPPAGRCWSNFTEEITGSEKEAPGQVHKQANCRDEDD